jgi:hypothetical protein
MFFSKAPRLELSLSLTLTLTLPGAHVLLHRVRLPRDRSHARPHMPHLVDPRPLL